MKKTGVDDLINEQVNNYI